MYNFQQVLLTLCDTRCLSFSVSHFPSSFLSLSQWLPYSLSFCVAKLFEERNQIKCPGLPFVAYAISNYARTQAKLVQGRRRRERERATAEGQRAMRVSQVRGDGWGRGMVRAATTLNGSANGIECSCAFLQFKFLIEITNWCQRETLDVNVNTARIQRECECGCEYKCDECESLTIYKYVYEKKMRKTKNKARNSREGGEAESYDWDTLYRQGILSIVGDYCWACCLNIIFIVFLALILFNWNWHPFI